MTAIRDLETVVTHGLCLGCGLCESMAGRERVEMAMSPASQLRPRIKERLDGGMLSRILAACPGVILHGHGVEVAGRGGRMHLIWGPWASLARGHATDPAIRFKAAAGGMLTALGVYLVESGKVDCIVHVAASTEAPMHTDARISTTREEVIGGAQSRYGPAAPLTDVMRLLDEGKRFAVIGKPCDVAAMRNLARIDERVEAQVPYLLTIFCGGLPTLATAEKIAESFELTEDELEIFRFRGEGWPGMTHMKTKDGRVFEITYDQAWYQDQPWTYDIQFRCKICPDAIGELADVACPDAWEMTDGGPVHEEGEGWNVILARTEKGAALVEEAVAAGYVTREPYGIDEFDSQHTEHAWRKQANFARVLGLAAAGQPRPSYRNFRRLRTALGAGFGVNWRGFAGMLRRVRAGRNREPLV
jgi:coenzyme F420 hydrogenase subunit beta